MSSLLAIAIVAAGFVGNSPFLVKAGAIESTSVWDACKEYPEVHKHQKSYVIKSIAPDQAFDMKFLEHFKAQSPQKYRQLTLNPQKYYQWRNDEQINQVCHVKDSSDFFLKLYNNMEEIKLKPRQKKITLILDMDETLFNRPQLTSRGKKITFINPRGEIETHYVKSRPHLREFLEFVSQYADLFVWTMSTLSRTETILQTFGLRHFFKQLITHVDVTRNPELPPVHIKAIQKAFDQQTGFKNVLHIDDRPGTFLLNQLNGLRIRKFESEDEDSQLLEFQKILGWAFRCHDAYGDMRDCVALLKTTNPGYFDGLLPNEYVEPTEDEYIEEPAQVVAGKAKSDASISSSSTDSVVAMSIDDN